jgi:hypothetical protein
MRGMFIFEHPYDRVLRRSFSEDTDEPKPHSCSACFASLNTPTSHAAPAGGSVDHDDWSIQADDDPAVR